jgi:hypothetical protein
MRDPLKILLVVLVFAVGLLLWGMRYDLEFARGIGVLLTLFCVFAFPTVTQNTPLVHSAERHAE